MKYNAIVLLIMLASTTVFGQDVPRKSIYGTYYQQDGLPGRTFKLLEFI
jgi:hypothetical protein